MPCGIWLTLKECKNKYSNDIYRKIKARRKMLSIGRVNKWI